ncbi:TNF receptor-associated factor 4-like [Halichondria panicea]|uniref:TNF receptor-associated factor 4-like n=1 Tax=Halichondria panicea TaxID=6063 RepID=UPI00312BAD33
MIRKNLQAHLESKCPNRLHKCPDCGANNQYKNHQLHTKLHCPKRLHCCVHCGENGCFDSHLEICPKMKIACKKCTQRILRCQLPTHPKECTFEPVPCKYAAVGCKVRPLRKDVKKHEENYQLHLQVTIETVLELKKMFPKPVVPVTYQVTDFDKHKKANRIVHSPPFYTSTTGYKMCLRIDANGNDTGEGTHVSVFTCLLAGEYDDYLAWPFVGTVTIKLLNQLENQSHYLKTYKIPADNEASQRVVDGERGPGYGHLKFTSHADLAHKPRENIQYLKDDTLIFRDLHAEAPDYKPWLECTDCV